MNIDVESRRVDVKNGNGNHDLTSVATLEDQLERMPAVALPSVRVEEAALKADRLAEIVELLLLELGLDVGNQHLRVNASRNGPDLVIDAADAAGATLRFTQQPAWA